MSEKEFAKLPEAEFEVMEMIWKQEPPVTTTTLMAGLGNQKGWKLQTLVTLLNRLISREFIRTEKHGKERLYYPCVSQSEYLTYETNYFVKKYHQNSIFNFISAFYGDSKLSKKEADELETWLKQKEEQE